jgi:hypothetical protein
MAIDDHIQTVRERRSPPAAGGQTQPPEFEIGDYVLKARAEYEGRNKLRAHWMGPYRVVDTVNPQLFRVAGLLAGDDEFEVHSTRLVYFAPATMKITRSVLDLLAHDDAGHTVEEVQDHRAADDGRLEVLIRWAGFEDDDVSAVTWELAEEVTKTAPIAVKKYAQTLGTDVPARRVLETLVRDQSVV